jgi:hypothetical protein
MSLKRLGAYWSLVFGFLGPIAIAVALHFVDLRDGDMSWLQAVAAVSLVAQVPIGAALLHRRIAAVPEGGVRRQRPIFRLLASAALSVLWFFVTLAVYINVHLAFGGPI